MTTRNMVWAVVLFLASGSLAAPCRADTAVMQPLQEQSATAAADRSAYDAVRTGLASAGIQVVSDDEARARLVAAAEKLCTNVDCAGSLLRALGADMLVGVSVGSRDGTPVDVVVQLVDIDAKFVNATADVENGKVDEAASAAFQRALSKWPVRNLVPVTIEGAPAGATVLIDGQPKGTLPLETKVQAGEHVVSVSMSGYVSQERSFVATTTPGESALVKVELATERGSTEARRAHWIGGTLLAAGGVAALAVGLVPLSQRGCTEHGVTGKCVEEKVVGTGPMALWTTLGTVSLAGGVAWIIRGERRNRRGTAARVDLGVGPTTVAVKGSF